MALQITRKYFTILLLFIFGLNPVINSFVNFYSKASSAFVIDDVEESDTEVDDDDFENEQFSVFTQNFLQLSIDKFLSKYKFINDNKHVIFPHIEITTPPPDFA